MKLVVLSFCLLGLVGCASTGPVQGSLFADIKGPIGVTARPKGSVEGKACAKSFFGLIAIGDASVSAAMDNAGIRTVSHVEQSTKNIIGLSTFCTHVWGSKRGSRKK
ncbi:MAG: TRL-like family protein [Bdellovibrionales bacterium]